jgi:hypothetical protein
MQCDIRFIELQFYHKNYKMTYFVIADMKDFKVGRAGFQFLEAVNCHKLVIRQFQCQQVRYTLSDDLDGSVHDIYAVQRAENILLQDYYNKCTVNEMNGKLPPIQCLTSAATMIGGGFYINK